AGSGVGLAKREAAKRVPASLFVQSTSNTGALTPVVLFLKLTTPWAQVESGQPTSNATSVTRHIPGQGELARLESILSSSLIGMHSSFVTCAHYGQGATR